MNTTGLIFRGFLIGTFLFNLELPPNVAVYADTATIRIHALNSEGIELGSIPADEMGNRAYAYVYTLNTSFPVSQWGENGFCIRPIPILSGDQIVRVGFNGMEQFQEISIIDGEVRDLVFVFQRIEVPFEFSPITCDAIVYDKVNLDWIAGNHHPVISDSIYDCCGLKVHINVELSNPELIVPYTPNTWCNVEYHLGSKYDISSSEFDVFHVNHIDCNGSGFKLQLTACNYFPAPIPFHLPAVSSHNAWFVQTHSEGQYPLPYVSWFEVPPSMDDPNWYPLSYGYAVYDGWAVGGTALRPADRNYRWLMFKKFRNEYYGSCPDIPTQYTRPYSISQNTHYEGTMDLRISSVPYDMDGTGIKYEPADPPIAEFVYPEEHLTILTPITFDASTSGDPDGNIVSYEWDFDDFGGDEDSKTEGAVLDHTYSKPGLYTVTLWVKDDKGFVTAKQKEITVGASDQDGDGLLDGWEAKGLDVNADEILDLDLHSLGANPKHKDLFVEVDCLSGQSFPQPAQNMVIDSFSNAPVINPDGATGINLHIIIDEQNLVSSEPVWMTMKSGTNKGWAPEYDSLKIIHFGTPTENDLSNPNRENIIAAKKKSFRYCIIADQQDDPNIAGTSEYFGNDFFITLGSKKGVTNTKFAAVFMHELGHNLGLHHGGKDKIDGKPNYISIMNYLTREPHAWSKPFWRLDFSRDEFDTLDEQLLDERIGIRIQGQASLLYKSCQMPYGYGPEQNRRFAYAHIDGSPIDWNTDGDFVDPNAIQEAHFNLKRNR